ncbi:MAG: tyrosine-type recombinase/integrase [Veillonella sp.]|uniref:site-specific tyrosine recombinase/integron integrase n=1 Tax=Veillonella sp. TaxID=1926307 RepID=UPI002914360A|nr:site-specific tyrosine recombinase/integron integrase [Veillonella sp.]MDU5682865.1 tyrosine-type recombinase/integrase [Veillonella sp.]MDU5736594.1 tyrosine-type recombinase/integrase [Veillonella sp.]MDU5834596.1 tyrosine-type recombinase/integrase [Veillonella sp.]
MQQLINDILHDMSEVLSAKELYALQIVLQKKLNTQNNQTYPYTNIEYMDMFISAKRIEGCSERTLAYYKTTIEHMLSIIVTPLRQIQTDDLRAYLAEYQLRNNCSKTTVDNIRRNLSSFFSWLEAEDYIIKSPIRRIHKIRTGSKVKETLSEECIEKLRDSCLQIRDLAMIDLLYSTGIRVGELVNLNINDINFEERECIVYGKGNKQRKVYFDAKTKVHLKRYLEQRKDYSEALFVTLDSPFERLKISGVEIRLRKLGRLASLDQRVHPHKFRRSMATRAIDKGMPIEQVQKLLGHQQIDTTMHYAMVNQSNVKISHRKFIG